LTTTSGFLTGRRVSPRCPFWPPDFLFDRSRKLLTRGTRVGFFSPSLAGGLLLLLLFSPNLRSSSPTRCLQGNIFRAYGGVFLLKPPGRCHPSVESDSSRGTRPFAPTESIRRNGQHWPQHAHETWAVTFIASSDEKPVTLGVATDLVRGDIFYWGELMAAALIASVPIAIAYNLFLDRFISGITGGAVK
jgi:hypothetical protein